MTEKDEGLNKDRPADDKATTHASPSSRSRGRRRPFSRGFYIQAFTEQELDDLAAKTKKERLQDEIDLLKVFIRREALSQKQDEKVDLREIRTTVDTLCRALKTQSSLEDKTVKDRDDALYTALAEASAELGIALWDQPDRHSAERKACGPPSNGD